jgi:tetratricopeptide (TPR) repeat protein
MNQRKAVPTISLAMIVKNEEHTLRECLRSAKDFVNEMVVVDTGSSDSTMDIAKKEGAKVYKTEWKDDFSLARNTALQYCSCEWILQLDADERLVVNNRDAVYALLSDSEALGYIVTIHSKVGNGNVFAPALRLFKNHPAIKYEGVVHEQVYNAIIQLGGKVIPVPLVIDHSGYENPEIHKIKAQRNVSLLRNYLAQYPDDITSILHYAMGLVTLQQYDEAKEQLEKLLKNPAIPVTGMVLALNLLGQIANEEGKAKEALTYAKLSLKEFNNQFYGRSVGVVACIHLQQYEQALCYLKEMENMSLSGELLNRDFFYDTQPPDSELLELTGACLAELGRYNEAFDYFLRALENRTSSSTVIHHIQKLLGQVEISNSLAKRIESIVKSNAEHNPSLRLLWIEYLSSKGKYCAAKEYALEHSINDREVLPIQVRWMIDRGDANSINDLLKLL